MSGLARASGVAPDASLPFLRMADPFLPAASGSHRGAAGGGLRVAPFPPAARRRWSAWTAPVPVGMLGSILLSLFPATDSYAEQRIGRLFSSPEQRIELDRMRNDPGPGVEAEPIVDRAGLDSRHESASHRPAHAVTVNGVVLRGDGHRVAWIDGVEIAAGTTTPAGVRIEAQAPGGGLRIRLPEGRASAVLKPGQALDANGRVREVYERRPANSAASPSALHRRRREHLPHSFQGPPDVPDAGGVGESQVSLAERAEAGARDRRNPPLFQ